ncbi:hypothetical protein [Acetivibrio ethanolgignens]|uniref:Uncharacterized protein n=1 Tax=Acetivibrio ethanolgignens TaxID=290052 RepID=A0A0V8QCJ3_9FIRM|nr:hypothetical protein [Acetivibrio ethanolgignens]KSV58263.1 hypothetical protein ASU35_13450 [Acetivibrio ethanolgignens]
MEVISKSLEDAIYAFPVRKYNGDVLQCSQEFVSEYGGKLSYMLSGSVMHYFVEIGSFMIVSFELPARVFDSVAEYAACLDKYCNRSDRRVLEC